LSQDRKEFVVAAAAGNADIAAIAADGRVLLVAADSPLSLQEEATATIPTNFAETKKGTNTQGCYKNTSSSSRRTTRRQVCRIISRGWLWCRQSGGSKATFHRRAHSYCYTSWWCMHVTIGAHSYSACCCAAALLEQSGELKKKLQNLSVTRSVGSERKGHTDKRRKSANCKSEICELVAICAFARDHKRVWRHDAKRFGRYRLQMSMI